MAETLMNNANIVFVSHGGGPLPVLGDSGHTEMVSALRHLADALPRPKAILVISAHWEEAHPTVTSAFKPGMMYDYSGFPDAAYQLQYPSPGDPALAKKVVSALEQAGIRAEANPDRPYDHGLYIPLMLMYPEADIPAIQLSLVKGLDPEQHLRIGEALRELDGDGLLIIGSGFSFHNMRAFFSPESEEKRAANVEFQSWLENTCMSTTLREEDRRSLLQHWSDAPSARYCHPREEHLLPLHVCYGIAGRAADEHMATTILGKASGMYAWTA